MPTGQVIVTAALTRLGINEQGGTPNVSDSTDALANLNDMWQAWGIDEGMIYAVQAQQFAWTANTASNAIGPNAGAPFNVPLPARIYAAYWVTASGRNEIKVVSAPVYFAHNDLAATAKTPDELYADFLVNKTTGSDSLFPWPIPSQDAILELTTAVTFAAWALGVDYKLPQGLQDDITWALAYRLLSTFGAIVAREVADNVREEGMKAEQRIRAMNKINRQLPNGAEMPPETPQPKQAA